MCSYIQAGNALGLDLLNNPDLITSDPVVAFKVALWFWMTPQVGRGCLALLHHAAQ